MKRLILILAVVCTVFIGCSSLVSAYNVKDEINGIVLADNATTDFTDCVGWFERDGKTWLLTTIDFYVNTTTNKFVAREGSSSDYIIYQLRDNTSSKPGTISTKSNLSVIDFTNITASSFDIVDSNGNVVFPLPPTPTPTPTPGLEGITAELLLTVLSQMKTILLGLAVSVIGFLAFRKAWNWVLTNFRAG